MSLFCSDGFFEEEVEIPKACPNKDSLIIIITVTCAVIIVIESLILVICCVSRKKHTTQDKSLIEREERDN